MTRGCDGEMIVVMQIARVAPIAVILTALSAWLTESHLAAVAHANGESGFSLRDFTYDRTAYLTKPDRYGGQDLVNVNLWRVTVCTSRPARLRIRAIVLELPHDYRFVRRQPAGCKRHRLRAASDQYPEGLTTSRLRVAWRNQRRRTRWLEAADPAPD
jgi:hypothetical protein